MTTFNYSNAFSRNLGWVTESEQLLLKSKKVAIAGLGGVGGAHVLTLSRIGVGNFSIADMDTFDWANMNRQAGAFASTIGRTKIDVMSAQIKDINPEANLNLFPEGLTEANMDQFLQGADLYIDSLDIFCADIRRKVFIRCRELGITAITAAPVGMGTAVLVFDPKGMSYDEYFDLAKDDLETQVIKFLVGVSPSMLWKKYFIRLGTFDIKKRDAPSLCVGIDLAAGVAVANALKILLGRGEVRFAPKGLHFDAYLNRLKKTWVPFGNRNILQKIKILGIKMLLKKQAK